MAASFKLLLTRSKAHWTARLQWEMEESKRASMHTRIQKGEWRREVD